MKISRKSKIQDEIDLFNIVRILYKNKLLILSFCLISIVMSFFVSKSLHSPNQADSISEIKITKIPNDAFNLYEFALPGIYDGKSSTSINLYNNQFISLINSKENLIDYFDSYGKELINIVSLNEKFIKKDKIFFADYFFNKISKIDDINKVYISKFFFNNDDIDGQKFLNHYFNFTQKKTNSIVAKYLINIITDYLIFFENEKEIAKKLNLISPNLQNNNIISEKMYFIMGAESINSRINFLIFIKKKLGENELSISKYFNISKASNQPKLKLDLTQKHMQVGFLIGFLLSLIVIFFKTNFKKLKYT